MPTPGEIRQGLEALIAQTERDLTNYRKALAELTGTAERTEPRQATPQPAHAASVSVVARRPQRSSEQVAMMANAALAHLRAAPGMRARVVDVYRSLVEQEFLTVSEKDREFTRYLLRKLERDGLAVDEKRGYYRAIVEGEDTSPLRAVAEGG